MSYMSKQRDQVKPAEVNSPPCNNAGCNSSCSYAFSCYEARMGRGPHVPWPLVALAGVAVAALFV